MHTAEFGFYKDIYINMLWDTFTDIFTCIF